MARKRKQPSWLVLLVVIVLGIYGWYDARSSAPEGESPVRNTAPETTVQAGHLGEEAVARLERLCIPQGSPRKASEIVRHTGYTVCFNTDRQIPDWVAYVLTDAEVGGQVPRKDRFVPDPDIPGMRATTDDYKGSGYDRGHMAPAADMKWSEEAMKESFYLSNICPQNRNLNKGDWNDLEEKVRDWAGRYGALCIVCGPVDDTGLATIGANDVAVPKRFFKVILRQEGEKFRAMGFLFANQSGSRDLKEYAVSVDRVERETGLDFFSALPDDAEDAAEALCVPEEWGL